jgi:hypothetical protein
MVGGKNLKMDFVWVLADVGNDLKMVFFGLMADGDKWR